MNEMPWQCAICEEVMATEAQATGHECGKVEPVFVAEPPPQPAVTAELMIQLALTLERIADSVEKLARSSPYPPTTGRMVSSLEMPFENHAGTARLVSPTPTQEPST